MFGDHPDPKPEDFAAAGGLVEPSAAAMEVFRGSREHYVAMRCVGFTSAEACHIIAVMLATMLDQSQDGDTR